MNKQSSSSPTTNPKRDDYYEIEQEYRTLADGVSVAGRVCPRCKGGRTGEGSLSVTRTADTLKFMCHRAACTLRGVLTIHGRAPIHGEPRPSGERQPDRPSYATVGKGPFPDFIAHYLAHFYELGPAHLAKGLFQWTEQFSPATQGRVLMPVFDPEGLIYGFTARKLDDQPGAKTLNYIENSKGCWYKGPPSRDPKLLIVEDQMSALRASSYMNSMALLGTNLTDEALKCIKAGQYPRIFVALDSDAFPTAIKMTRRIRDAGVPATVLKLPNKDIKNMNEIELVNWLDDVGINWYE